MKKLSRSSGADQTATRDVARARSNPCDDWVCGHAELGMCCTNGPTRDGRCGRIRSDLLNRGSNEKSVAQLCEESFDGKLDVCIPRRSSRWNRNSTRTNLAILAGGILLFSMALPTREQTFVPGPLTSKHSQILENTLVAERCGLCHPNSQLVVDSKLQSAWGLTITDGLQDQLCMNCHRAQLPKAIDRNPHDLTAAEWQSLTKKRESAAMLFVNHSRAAESDQDLMTTSCASCHIEHHGREFDLKSMADDRCQACHQRQFESFASGHPEFKDFPLPRPRALAFSHQLHSEKHFPTKNRDFDCQKCHVDPGRPAAVGPVSRSVSFEKACADCHSDPIKAATIEGWAMLQLPSIDSAAATGQSDLENWPQAARFGFEGAVSPVLRGLLAADDEARETIEQIPSSGQLTDLTTDSQRRQGATIVIALATERLIVQTADRGQAEWLERLEKVTKSRLRRELNAAERSLIAAMCRGMPPDLFREMKRAWFQPAEPSVNNEEVIEEATPGLELLKLNAPVVTGGEDNLLSSNADFESTAPSPTQPEKSIKGATHVSGGGWYLDHSTLALRYMPIGHADPILAAWSLWWHQMEMPNSGPTSNLGWQPRVLSQKDGTNANSLPNQLPGGCLQCHTLPKGSTSADSIWSLNGAWRTNIRPVEKKEFTRFNHAPHLALPAVKDCRYCHKMHDTVKKSGVDRAHIKGPPLSAQVDFQTIEKAQCVACHLPGGANVGCLQCHNYHITSENTPESSVFR